MNNEMEKTRNSRNKFELEGNVANISDIYVNQNGKKTLRFDLAQNNNDSTQFVPIVLRGELVNTYGEDIQKGAWVTIKGRITSYSKDVEKNSKTFKEKIVEMLGFEVIDRKNNKVYTSDGKVADIKNKSDEMER